MLLLLVSVLLVSTSFSRQRPKAKEKPEVLQKISTLVKQNEKSHEKSTITIWGLDFVTYDTHFQVSIWYPNENDYFENFLSKAKGSFLEIGCGAGQYSVRAALNGAKKVTAVDINEEAIKNTQENAEKHGIIMGKKFQVFKSDIFEKINRKKSKFDVIFWNFPFIYLEDKGKELSDIEMGIYDPGYKLLRRFLKKGHFYLKQNGRMYITWSRELANQKYFDYAIKKSNWKKRLYEEIQLSMEGNPKMQLWELESVIKTDL